MFAYTVCIVAEKPFNDIINCSLTTNIELEKVIIEMHWNLRPIDVASVIMGFDYEARALAYQILIQSVNAGELLKIKQIFTERAISQSVRIISVLSQFVCITHEQRLFYSRDSQKNLTTLWDSATRFHITMKGILVIAMFTHVLAISKFSLKILTSPLYSVTTIS